ncbi:MAG: thioredoxin domain-containing protein [Hyphomonadaceae bacterium]|nr:thioredoxin domain-containing protein [Hyphomonadaceae bacterium]
MTASSLSRRCVLAGGLIFASAGLPSVALAQSDDDMTIGAATAPLHIIEYASLTCPHCAQFHATNWRPLKERYIDAGRVRFTLREMATPPAPVALAMFQLARCQTSSPDLYLERVGILFERQQAILGTGTGAGVRDALLAIGAEWGLSPDQIAACFNDPAGVQRMQRSVAVARELGVNHTPSFIFNGVLDDDHDFQTPEGMVRILEARLAAL